MLSLQDKLKVNSIIKDAASFTDYNFNYLEMKMLSNSIESAQKRAFLKLKCSCNMLLYKRLSAKCKIKKIFRLILHCCELLKINSSFVLVVFKMLKMKVLCPVFIVFD